MEEKQVGPRDWRVYGYTSCMGCCHHDQTMIKSGRNPIYWHYCNHPDSKARPESGLAWTGLKLLPSKGRLIGENHVTPDWCPVLKGERNEP